MTVVSKPLLLKQFKAMPKMTFVQMLMAHIEDLNLPVGDSQIKSWEDCYEYMQRTFAMTAKYDEAIIIFEYCLPLSNYRRPDVILLWGQHVIVLEFKRKNLMLLEDLEQLLGYLNALRHYHVETSLMNLKVNGALIVTEALENKLKVEQGYAIVEGFKLLDYIEMAIHSNGFSMKEADRWFYSAYEPLPNILRATYKMFKDGEIPQVKNIEESEIQQTLDYLVKMTSSNTNKKRLFLLTGVPGSGKTLAQLYTAYHLNQSKLNALFLSGNDPLVYTLSHILSKTQELQEGSSFIKGVKNYKSEFYNKRASAANILKTAPPTICFDEAQRAWNLQHMRSYNFSVSEPELIMQVQNQAQRQHGFSNIIASIGFGQNIYVGEEDGFDTWKEVLLSGKYNDWQIYSSPELEEELQGIPNVEFVKELHLDTSIRSNFIDTSPWIEAVLNLDHKKAKKELEALVEKGYPIYIAYTIDEATGYLERKVQQTKDEFYGLVASSNCPVQAVRSHLHSKARLLERKDAPKSGEWYLKDCKKLESIATEFVCQGLELNTSVVFFGGDYFIQNGMWTTNTNKTYKYEQQTMQNIYRVLLSRGRIGMILFIPEIGRNCETIQFLREIGLKRIDEKGIGYDAYSFI